VAQHRQSARLVRDLPQAFGAPELRPVVIQAERQNVAVVRRDLQPAEEREALLPGQGFDLIPRPDGIVLGDADAVQAEGLRPVDQVDRVQVAAERAQSGVGVQVDYDALPPL